MRVFSLNLFMRKLIESPAVFALQQASPRLITTPKVLFKYMKIPNIAKISIGNIEYPRKHIML